MPFDWAAMAPIVHDARRRDPARWEAAAMSSVVSTIPVGHHIHREAPDEFAAAVLPHLSHVADATV